MIDRRAGRNPPFVLGSICLLGIPAPCAELIGVYVPFHRVGWLFILARQPSQRFRIMGICWRKVAFLCQSPDSHPMLYSITPPHGGRSFLKPRKARKLLTGSPTNGHFSHLSFKPFARPCSVCDCSGRLPPSADGLILISELGFLEWPARRRQLDPEKPCNDRQKERKKKHNARCVFHRASQSLTVALFCFPLRLCASAVAA